MADHRPDLWTLLFSTSEYEQDAGFRAALGRVTHRGLKWAGLVGLVGLLSYVVLSLVILGKPAVVFPSPRQGPGTVLLLDDLYNTGIAVLCLVFAWRRCSLTTGRRFMAWALLSAAAVTLYDDLLYGDLQDPGFLTVIYMLAVVAVPFRPWQVLALGGSIGGLLLALSPLGLLPTGTGPIVEHLPLLGVVTALMTGITSILYVNRWAEYRARERTQEALDEHRLLLRTTQEVGNIGGWQFDLESSSISWTRQVYRIYDLSPDVEPDLNALLSPYPSEARTALRTALVRCMETGEPFDLELPLEEAGEARWVEIRGDAVDTNENGSQIVGTIQDITVRREMEEDLRDSENWLRTITQNITDGLYRSTPDEGVVYANEAFATMFGYDDPDDLRDVDPTSLYADPEQRGPITRRLEEEGQLDRVEIEFRRKDGSTFVGLLTSTAVEDETGDVQFYDGAITEITERKEKERELQHERDRFATLFDNLPAPVAYGKSNDDGIRVQAVNDAFESVFGLDETAIEEEDLHEHVLNPGSEHTQESPAEQEQTDGPLHVEVERMTADGPRDFHVLVAFKPAEDSTVEGYAIYTDVTDRTDREEQWRERGRKIEGLFAAVNTLLHAERADDVAAQVEVLATDTLDYPLTTIRLVDDGDLLPVRNSPGVHEHVPERSDDDLTGDRPAARAFRSEKTIQYDDARDASPDLELGDARAVAYVPIDDHGVISIASLESEGIDSFDVRLLELLAETVAAVLDRIDREQALVRAKEDAEEANRLKSSFLANVSHEIRTPLTSIIGFAEAIGDTLSNGESTDGGTESTVHFARLIEKSGRLLLDTLNSVLGLSQLESGSMRFATEHLDVREPVEEAVDLFAPRADSAGLDLEAALPDSPLPVQTDEDALQRILHNLLSNAIKFTEAGGSVVVRTTAEENEVVVAVEDTGRGIDPDFRPDLFAPFEQGPTAGDRSDQGSGLGLAVTKRLVEHLDGSIDVESTPGEGTIFRVRLPRGDA